MLQDSLSGIHVYEFIRQECCLNSAQPRRGVITPSRYMASQFFQQLWSGLMPRDIQRLVFAFFAVTHFSTSFENVVI